MPQEKTSPSETETSTSRVPAFLNALALAGTKGVPLQTPSDASAVKICRDWGIDISVSGDRAFLTPDSDLLVPVLIEQEVTPVAWNRIFVEGFFKIGSTNDEALARGRNEAPEGLLIYAEEQTAGRGRQQRQWHSPARAGLYFSLLVRPPVAAIHWPLLTHVASVALVRALEDVSSAGKSGRPFMPEIKWPNDVLLSGRKTAGILLETVSHLGIMQAAILGIGVNMTAAAIPSGYEQWATAVNVEAAIRIPRRKLLVRFLEHFQTRYLLFKSAAHVQILHEWKQCSTMWDGVPVQVVESGRVLRAVTCGLTDSGALRIRTQDGNEETVLAGDVSIRCI